MKLLKHNTFFRTELVLAHLKQYHSPTSLEILILLFLKSILIGRQDFYYMVDFKQNFTRIVTFGEEIVV